MRTILTHFYNEEYLLPWWLEHHKKYFDNGILINYASTDRSVEICKDICPHWYVIDTRNSDFNAYHVDNEIEFYEKHVSGWKISITLTEFLVGDIDKLLDNNIPEPRNMQDPNVREYSIPVHMFNEWNPTGTLDKNIPLWEQCKLGIPYQDHDRKALSWWGRIVHNHKFMRYLSGRHSMYVSNYDAAIFKYSNAIISEQMLKRRLQIQTRIAEDQKYHKNGWQHYSSSIDGKEYYLDEAKLFEQISSFNPIVENCDDLISSLITKM